MKINTDNVMIAGTSIPSPLFQYLGNKYGKEWTVSVPEWQFKDRDFEQEKKNLQAWKDHDDKLGL